MRYALVFIVLIPLFMFCASLWEKQCYKEVRGQNVNAALDKWQAKFEDKN